ncbi:hypothetical protein AD951_03550, partial [Acetobacter malorum]
NGDHLCAVRTVPRSRRSAVVDAIERCRATSGLAIPVVSIGPGFMWPEQAVSPIVRVANRKEVFFMVNSVYKNRVIFHDATSLKKMGV